MTDDSGIENVKITNFLTARKVAQDQLSASIAEEQAILARDIECLRAYEIECAKGTVTTETFDNCMKGASVTAQQYATNIKNGTGSASAYANSQRAVQSSLAATSASSKAAAIAVGALNMVLNAVIIIGVIKGLEAIGTAIDRNIIHKADYAKKAVEDSRSAYDEVASSIESMNNELETTTQRIEELQNKGVLTFTEQEELDRLKKQNDELERTISLEEKKAKNKAKVSVATIYDTEDTLSSDFEKDLRNYDKQAKQNKENLEIDKQDLKDGIITLREYEENVSDYESLLVDSEEKIISDIEEFEKQKQDIVNKYGSENIEDFNKSDQNLYKRLTARIQEGYKKIYSDSEYNKFVIEPIFNDEKLGDIQDKLLSYFSSNGSTDISALETRFGTDIIEALQTACENAGVDFDYMIGELYKNASKASDEYNKAINRFSSESEILDKFFKDNSIDSVEEIDYWNKVTKGAKNATEAINLYNKAKEGSNQQSTLSFDDAWTSLEDSDKETKNTKKDLTELADTGRLTNESFKKVDGYKEFLAMMGKTEDEIDEVVKKINGLSDSTSQLNSMRSGIKGLSDNLNTKKQEPSKAIDVDTLSGMDAELKAQTKEWEHYVSVIGDVKSSYEDVKKATNELATAYVNSNNFLANLTDANKAYYITQLQNMGVENAEAVVLDSLNSKQRALELSERALSAATSDMAAHTDNATSAFLAETEMSKNTKIAIMDVVAAQTIFNNQSLDVSGKISSLQSLISAYMGVAAAAQFAAGVDGMRARYEQGVGEFSGKSAADATALFNQLLQQKYSGFTETQKDPVKVDVSPINSQTKTPTGSKSKGSSGSDSKTQIDWLDRALTALQNKIDLTKSKFDVLFDYKAKDNNLKKQLEQTTELLNAEATAANRYKSAFDKYFSKSKKIKVKDEKTGKKVDKKVKINSTLEKAGVSIDDIKNGRLKGKDLIKEYGQETAKIIQEAMGYWDKYQESTKSYFEKQKEVLDIVQQRLDLITEKYDEKRKKLDDKNKLLETKYSLIGESDVNSKIENIRKRVDVAEKTKDTYTNELREKKADLSEAKSDVTASLKKKNFVNQSKSAELKKKIKSYIKAKKTIPDSLINQTLGQLHNDLMTYNLTLNDVTEAQANKEQSYQDWLVTQRESRIEMNQLMADQAENAYNLNQLLASNSGSSEERVGYEKAALGSMKTQYEYLVAIARIKGDTAEVARLEAEWYSKQNDAYLEMFNTVARGYDQQVKTFAHMMNMYDKAIQKQQELGHLVSDKFYEAQIGQTTSQLETMRAEYSALVSEFNSGKIKYGTEQWESARDKIYSLAESISDAENKIISLNNALRENDWKYLEKQISYIQKLIDEQDFFVKLMNDHELYDDGGLLNGYGQSASALYAGMMKSYREMADEYGAKAAELLAQYNQKAMSGDYDSTLYDKYQEYINLQRQAILNTIEEKNAIKKLIEDGYNKLLDYLDKIIARRKKMLQAERDLFNYQKSISEKTKNISTLQKQLASTANDDSEEMMAKRQKWEKELADAQEDLRETEYDKYISDQQDMLDTLKDEISEWLEALLKDEKRIEEKIQEQIDASNTNAQLVAETINKEAQNFNYTMTSELSKAVNNSNGIYSGINESLQEIIGMMKTWKSASNSEADEFDYSPETGNPNYTGEGLERVDASATPVSDFLLAQKARNYIVEHATTPTKSFDKLADINKALYADEKNLYTDVKGQKGLVILQEDLQGLCDILGIQYDGKDSSSTLYKELARLHLINSSVPSVSTNKQGLYYVQSHLSPKQSSTEYKNLCDINKLLYDNHKKVLTGTELEEVAKILGVPGGDYSFNGKLFEKLSKIGAFTGFAKGGVIGRNDGLKLSDIGLVSSTGDTNMLVAKPGERILTENQNANFERFTNIMENPNMQSFLANATKVAQPNVNTRSGDVSLQIGEINVAANNPQEFETELVSHLSNNRNVQKIMQNVIYSPISGKTLRNRY